MPIPYSIMESGRPLHHDEAKEYEDIFEEQVKLAREKGIKVNLIANKQYIPHEKLRSTGMRVCKLVERLNSLYGIDKLTLSNIYLMQQYGEHIKSMGVKIEMSIMINANTPDAVEQLMTTLPVIDSICLGDAFAHNIDAIAYLKEKYPNLELKLIPNHGCLINCIGNQQHHNYSSCVFDEESSDPIRLSRNNELAIANNVSATCRCYINKNGKNLNEMSFIRPEDTYVYDGLIDMLKISGREHTAEYILNIIEAYSNEKYIGVVDNLLDMSAGLIRLRNEHFPQDFGKKRSTCMHQCYKCNYCKIISDFVKTHTTLD